jgi:nucleotide-binding universal stress UspA family protein
MTALRTREVPERTPPVTNASSSGIPSAAPLPDDDPITVAGTTTRDPRQAEHDGTAVLVGFDGSPSSVDAIDIAARLLPGRSMRIAHIWAPPFGSPELRSALRRRAGTLDELMELLELEGQAEAERIAGVGVAVARAAGLQARPVVQRCYGDDGLELARLAERHGVPVLAVGSRGLTGVRAVIGSVSDVSVHYSRVPVLVVPYPLLSLQRDAADSGPVIVGVDGSDGARRALSTGAWLFGDRKLIGCSVVV